MTSPVTIKNSLTIHKQRIPFATREKAAYLILRRKGCSMNLIADCFGRSTSVIHRSLVQVEAYHHNVTAWGNRIDMRKLPRRAQRYMASVRRRIMMKLRDQWEAWVCGEGDRPP